MNEIEKIHKLFLLKEVERYVFKLKIDVKAVQSILIAL